MLSQMLKLHRPAAKFGELQLKIDVRRFRTGRALFCQQPMAVADPGFLNGFEGTPGIPVQSGPAYCGSASQT